MSDSVTAAMECKSRAVIHLILFSAGNSTAFQLVPKSWLMNRLLPPNAITVPGSHGKQKTPVNAVSSCGGWTLPHVTPELDDLKIEVAVGRKFVRPTPKPSMT